MAIKVVPYTPDWVEGVRQFNKRMEDGGVHWRWYEDPVDSWIPKRPGQRTWREHYLAIEDDTEVRAAYALKPHEYSLRGETQMVTDWQGPISEGVLSRKYNTLGLRLLRDMLKRYPLLYSWGHGGLEQTMLEMLRKLGWELHGTPFCFYVLRPFRFLYYNRYLRTTPLRRAGLNLLAFSGLGWLGMTLLHKILGIRSGRPRAGRAEVVPEFGAWADDLWERASAQYSLIAARDRKTMNALLPQGGWPPGIRLQVLQGDRVVGWAVVLDTQMSGDIRFGDLRVGSIIDCLAEPQDAELVVGAAFDYLRDQGVDLVFSNQSHPAWTSAFAAHGFLLLADRRIFAASPALKKALEPFDENKTGVHLTNMDGHGPMRM